MNNRHTWSHIYLMRVENLAIIGDLLGIGIIHSNIKSDTYRGFYWFLRRWDLLLLYCLSCFSWYVLLFMVVVWCTLMLKKKNSDIIHLIEQLIFCLRFIDDLFVLYSTEFFFSFYGRDIMLKAFFRGLYWKLFDHYFLE